MSRLAEATAVLFDLDGTLVDVAVDIEAVREELSALLAPLGWSGPLRPILPCIERAARAVARDEEDRRAWVARCRGVIDRAECAAPMTLRPGARAVLGAAAGRGQPVGIFTDNGRPFAQRAMTALDAQPRAIVTRDDVSAAKPDPEGACRAARALVPGGGSLWIVGDSARDAQAAAAARSLLRDVDIHIVGVTGGRSSRAQLESAGADRIVAELAAILA